MREIKDLTEIKLVILFIMKNYKRTVLLSEITDVVMELSLINYFMLVENIYELAKMNYIEIAIIEGREHFAILQKGQDAIEFFYKKISYSNRLKLEEKILELTKKEKISEVYADYSLFDRNYFYTECKIIENDVPLLEIKLAPLTQTLSKAICENFKKNYNELYAEILCKLTTGEGFSKYKAVIFDLDGTMLDTIKDLSTCMNNVLAKHNMPTHSVDAYREFIGNGVRALVKNSLPDYKKNDEDFISLCQNEIANEYKTHWKDETKPYDGIIKLLEILNKKGIKINVLSNKPDVFTNLMVEHFFGGFNFEAVFGERENIKRKPDPSACFEIAKINNIDISDFVYVGDSDIDMQTAKNANIFAVGATWGFRSEDELSKSGADLLIKTPLELLQLFS